MNVDGQQIIAFAIVAVAAVSVGRRMYDQIAALWTSSKAAACKSCGGCDLSKLYARSLELKQIQNRPPIGLKGTQLVHLRPHQPNRLKKQSEDA